MATLDSQSALNVSDRAAPKAQLVELTEVLPLRTAVAFISGASELHAWATPCTAPTSRAAASQPPPAGAERPAGAASSITGWQDRNTAVASNNEKR
jgi:hypothetical protein